MEDEVNKNQLHLGIYVTVDVMGLQKLYSAMCTLLCIQLLSYRSKLLYWLCSYVAIILGSYDIK